MITLRYLLYLRMHFFIITIKRVNKVVVVVVVCDKVVIIHGSTQFNEHSALLSQGQNVAEADYVR